MSLKSNNYVENFGDWSDLVLRTASSWDSYWLHCQPAGNFFKTIRTTWLPSLGKCSRLETAVPTTILCQAKLTPPFTFWLLRASTASGPGSQATKTKLIAMTGRSASWTFWLWGRTWLSCFYYTYNAGYVYALSGFCQQIACIMTDKVLVRVQRRLRLRQQCVRAVWSPGARSQAILPY